MSYTMRTVRGQPLRTKIVCTLGPASTDPDTIGALIEAGLSVVRLNMSHGSHDDHRAAFRTVRQVSEQLDRPIAIMMDLSGPKIRLHEIEGGSFELKPGDSVDFVRGDAKGTPEALTCSYPKFIDDVSVGEPVYINDGAIRLNVSSKDDDRVTCSVEVGGKVSSRKGINLPGTRISSPALTAKDKKDLELGVEMGADIFALSFVRSAAEVEDLRARLQKLDCNAQVVSKIEKPQALDELGAIIEASDAVMVARGDLGIEMPVESVPLHQKRIIRECRDRLKPVIVATQVLESMIENPTPTRAEVSDIANAIEDGCDALMLSAETATGRYPVHAVETMARVCRDVEKSMATRVDAEAFIQEHGGDPLRKAMVIGAEMIAKPLGAKFIVVRSESGVTARYLSKVRGPIPILAVHHDPEVLRRHALMWGVLPVRTGDESSVAPPGASTEFADVMEDDLRQLARAILDEKLVVISDRIVVISRYPWGEQLPPNNIRTMKIGDALGALP